MCENADYVLPDINDCADWADAIDATYPVLADVEGVVCDSWEYPRGITTVFVLDVGGVVAARHDTTDPGVVDMVRQDMNGLLR
jgi:hypothetical protein